MEIDVRYVATLARIALADEEADRLQGQLGRILDYIGKLNELDTSDVPPMAHPHAFVCPIRPDIPANPNRREALLGCAPEAEEGLFVVPRVIE